MTFLRQELRELSTEPRDLRKFALLVGGVLILLGAWFAFRQKAWHPSLWVPGALLASVGLIAPRSLKHVYLGWMAFALVLGMIVSTTLLTLFFYLVITPIGLAARVFGKDFLERKWSKAPTYWRKRSASGVRQQVEYEQQF